MTIWLFLMQLCLLLGSVQVADVNVEETAVGMVLGDAGRYLIGILAAMIMPPVVGRHITRLLFHQVAAILCPIAKFSAFLVTRTPALTADANHNAEQAPSCSAN